MQYIQVRIARPVWPAASLASLHGRRFDVVKLRERLVGSFALELKRPRAILSILSIYSMWKHITFYINDISRYKIHKELRVGSK